jgi:hypothetical protein
LGKLSAAVGGLFFAIAVLGLCGQNFGLFVMFGAIAVAAFATSYGTRTFYCGMCGAGDLMPAMSPKAQEFQLRHQAFDHVKTRITPPEIQYPQERNVTPPASEPMSTIGFGLFASPYSKKSGILDAELLRRKILQGTDAIERVEHLRELKPVPLAEPFRPQLIGVRLEIPPVPLSRAMLAWLVSLKVISFLAVFRANLRALPV